MDTNVLAGASALLRTDQIQQALSMTMMKQAAAQQNRMADLLARNTRQALQPAAAGSSGCSFSTYA